MAARLGGFSGLGLDSFRCTLRRSGFGLDAGAPLRHTWGTLEDSLRGGVPPLGEFALPVKKGNEEVGIQGAGMWVFE